MATANRVISANPRVISAAMALWPSPRPCNTPAPMAITFLMEPPISTPIVSVWYTAGMWAPKRLLNASPPLPRPAKRLPARSVPSAHLPGEGRPGDYGHPREMARPRLQQLLPTFVVMCRFPDPWWRSRRSMDSPGTARIRRTDPAHQMRRHDAEHHLRALQSSAKIAVTISTLAGSVKAGQIQVVLAGCAIAPPNPPRKPTGGPGNAAPARWPAPSPSRRRR